MQLLGVENLFARAFRLEERLRDQKTPLTGAGKLMRGSIETNIASGGRPTFTPLAASTIAARARRGTGSTPLYEYGNMVGGIREIVSSDSVEVGSDAAQANRMQYGWPNHTPARPWVMFQSEDIDGIESLFTQHYIS